jgi:hypothetical protein
MGFCGLKSCTGALFGIDIEPEEVFDFVLYHFRVGCIGPSTFVLTEGDEFTDSISGEPNS